MSSKSIQEIQAEMLAKMQAEQQALLARVPSTAPQEWADQRKPEDWAAVAPVGPQGAPWMQKQAARQDTLARADAGAAVDPMARAAAQQAYTQQSGTANVQRNTAAQITAAQERAAMDQYNAALAQAKRQDMLAQYGLGMDYQSGLGGVQAQALGAQYAMESADAQNRAQMTGSLLSAGGQAAMMYGASQQQQGGGGGTGYGATSNPGGTYDGAAPPTTSDARAKRAETASDRAALAWLGKVKPIAFTYRDPDKQASRGVDGGERDWPAGRPMLGVTTQDLGKSDVGGQMVREGDDGYEQIDPSAAIGPLIAAVAALKRRGDRHG